MHDNLPIVSDPGVVFELNCFAVNYAVQCSRHSLIFSPIIKLKLLVQIIRDLKRIRAGLTQFLVTISCRLKITRATEVQAASSARFMFAGNGHSPMCNNSSADFGSAW